MIFNVEIIMSKYKITFLSFILSFVVVVNGYSQATNEINIKPFQLLRKAKIAEKSGDIFTAIDLYELYDQMNPDNPKVLSALGRLYLREKRYSKAKEFLLKSYEIDPKNNLLDLYHLATVLQTLGEYDEAKAFYKKFISEAKPNKDLKEHSKLAKNQLDDLENIQELINNPLNVIITLLDTTVNKPHIEFSPIPYEDDKLIFGSLPENEVKYYNPDEDKLPVRKFYIAQRKANNKWKNLGEFDSVINGEDVNTGNGAFSYDKQRFYFTRCEKDFKNNIVCKIFVSNLVDNLWSEPEVLPEIINLPGYTSTMPAVGLSRLNTDMLYFVSNRPEGKGGMDIWFSYFDKKKNEWKEPKNCGKKINTVLDEITPYYNVETRKLYFSSNGHPGLGGFDIFRAEGEGNSFDVVQNIGAPINSSFDDLYYILTDDRQRAYFTSNRSGGYSLRHENCCDDIYEVIFKDYINIAVTGRVFGITDTAFFNAIKDQYRKDMTLNVDLNNNSDDVELLYNYPVTLYKIDLKTGKELFIKTDYTTPGYYFFNNLEQGFDYFISVKDLNKKEKKLQFTTKNIFKSDTLHLDAIIISTFPKESFVVQNIYYEFAKADLTPEAKTTIDNTIYRILIANPSIIVEISSHTDSIDTEERNLILSQKRAQSVVDYLIKKGINPERLVPKGYGESFPIAPNSNPDGTDNPEGRAKNRRTEFKVIGILDDDVEIIYEDD